MQNTHFSWSMIVIFSTVSGKVVLYYQNRYKMAFCVMLAKLSSACILSAMSALGFFYSLRMFIVICRFQGMGKTLWGAADVLTTAVQRHTPQKILEITCSKLSSPASEKQAKQQPWFFSESNNDDEWWVLYDLLNDRRYLWAACSGLTCQFTCVRKLQPSAFLWLNACSGMQG